MRKALRRLRRDHLLCLDTKRSLLFTFWNARGRSARVKRANQCVLVGRRRSFFLALTCSFSAVRADQLPHSQILNWGEGAPDTLDPHAVSSTTDVTGQINLYDSLYRYFDNPPQMKPDAATSYGVSKDGRQWTFQIRRGMKFHDGSELTSDDVVYSFKRILALKKAPSAAFWPILKPENVIATGKYSVQMTLERPYAPFFAAIPLVSIVEKKLVDAHIVKNDWGSSWLAANDAGSGPYRAHAGFHPYESLTLDWFPDYFAGWPTNPVKQVNITTIKEASTLALALLKGEIDATDTRISADVIDRIRKGPNIKVAHDESMRTFVLTMNNSRPPFNNVHLRKAISYAFNYKGFVDKLREGTVVRNPGPLPENLWGNPKDLKGYSYDLGKAQQEIAAARAEGADLSRPLTVYGFTNTRDTYLATQLLQSNLQQIGLKVQIKDAFFPNLASLASTEETAPDMWFHWVSAFFVDPANWIGEMYDSQFHGTWKASAYYKNAKVDALLREALGETDQAKRRPLYEEASRLIVADAPALWIYNAIEYRGLNRRVQGYQFCPVGGGSYFQTMSLTQ